MKEYRQQTAGMQVHAGADGEPCTFFDGESVVKAIEKGRYIAIWDPVDVRENQ